MKMLKTTAFLSGIIAASIAMAQPAGVPQSIADYWDWTRLNIGRFTDNTTGAHPQPKDVYINLLPADFTDAAGATITPFPEGTIIIKERNDSNRLLVDRLYMMEKTAGGWSYSFFDRQADGSFAGQSFGLGPNVCSGCHQGAPTDFVFVQYETR